MPHLAICRNGCYDSALDTPRLVFIPAKENTYSSLICFGCNKPMTMLNLEKLPRAVIG